METELCRCCSGLNYVDCCKSYHQLQADAKTPEALMRSRYCAYALHLADYIVLTTHPNVRHLHQKETILAWAKANSWLKLEICAAQNNIVEFKAYYVHQNSMHVHHERSIFLIHQQKWFYLEGEYFEV